MQLNAHLAALPRLFRHCMPISTIGYDPRKTSWVDNRFQTFNFSLILSGEGDYYIDGQYWPVEAPCVITQWPGVAVRYGAHTSWEELFLIYSPGVLPYLQQVGFADLARPVWYMGESKKLRELQRSLAQQISELHEPGGADRIDRSCEQLVLESLLGQQSRKSQPWQRQIQRLRDYLEEHCLEEHDYGELARQAGMSSATFRRHWSRLVGRPPHAHLLQLRIQKACRLLVETDLAVHEIARSVSFADPQYFSRLFHQIIGISAKEYRREHQVTFALLRREQ